MCRGRAFQLDLSTNCLLIQKPCGISQGNSIYFFGKKRMSKRTWGFKAALNIIFFLLNLPNFAWFSKFNAVLRKIFIFKGELSLRARAESSRKMTSRFQCNWFSIDQWCRTENAISSILVKDVIKYLFSVDLAFYPPQFIAKNFPVPSPPAMDIHIQFYY